MCRSNFLRWLGKTLCLVFAFWSFGTVSAQAKKEVPLNEDRITILLGICPNIVATASLIETIVFWFIRHKTAAGTESLSFLIAQIGGGKDIVTMGELSERAFAEVNEAVLSVVFWIRIGVAVVYLLFLGVFSAVALSLRKSGRPRVNKSITFGSSE